jgi:hypothetical protein
MKHSKKMLQDVRVLHGQRNFIRSEYNHCVYGMFIILVLNFMLVPITSMFEINKLDQLVRTFVTKDLGEVKIILGHGNIQRKKYGKLGYRKIIMR